MIQHKLAIGILVAFLALLAACGGGGEQASPTATPESDSKLVPDLGP